MKNLLITAIILMIIVIGCDIETNANQNILDYTRSIALLPFLALAIYAITHLDEFKKTIKW